MKGRARRKKTWLNRLLYGHIFVLGTPRAIERRYGFRISFSLYVFGFHIKLRRDQTFRHLKVGARLQSAYGANKCRLSIWLGTFTTVEGKRVSAHGLIFTFAVVSKPSARHLPFAPEKAKARKREEPFEIL